MIEPGSPSVDRPDERQVPARRWTGAAFLLVVLVSAGAVALLGIQRPAYWVDEATTAMIVRWPWPDLLTVIQGQEAPLGPYYLLMRPWTALREDPWWFRLPSASAMVAAVVAIAWWARRRLGTASALAGAAVLLALPVFTRYAQEARPYGLLVLAAVGCAVAWWRWCERGGIGPATGYVVTVWLLGMCHVLALTLVVAQLVAAVVGAVPAAGTYRPRRRGLALRSVALAGVAGLPLLPFVWLVHRQAVGVAHPLPLTWRNAAATFTRSLTGPLLTVAHPGWLALGVVTLAGCAALAGIRGAVPRERAVLGFLVCWAVIPPGLLTLAAVSQETLVPRYFLVALPAWGMLAGRGAVAIGRMIGAGMARGRKWGVPARSVATVVGLVPLVALVAAGIPYQVHYRSPAGHGSGDIRPSIALLRTPAYRELPVILPPNEYWWVVVAQAYDPDLLRRNPLAVLPQIGPDRHLSLREVDTATARQRLAGRNEVAVLLRTSGDSMARRVVAALPELTGFGVAEVRSRDGWSVALMTRRPPAD